MIGLVNTAGVLEQASSLTGSPCHFILGTEHKPFGGGENLVFAVDNTRHLRIGIRVPRIRTPYTAQMVEKEVRFRKAIQRENIGRFQQLIGYSSSCNNLVQAPFIALSWTDGVRLQWTDQSPADEGDRNKVISSIAQATIDLLSVRNIGKSQIDAHHSGCYANPAQACSAREYIATKIDRKLFRAEKGELRGGTVAECLEQKRLIPDYWLPQLNDAFHVLVHGDLSANNVIINEHFDVKWYVHRVSSLRPANFVQCHRSWVGGLCPIAVRGSLSSLPHS